MTYSNERITDMVTILREEGYDVRKLDDTERGLYHKYDVRRVDGKPVGECFVLAHDDPYAAIALRNYAIHCAKTHPQLSEDLTAMARRWTERP